MSDYAYHTLLGNEKIMTMLLQAFLPPSIAQQCDWSTVTRQNSKYATQGGQQRISDVVVTVTLLGGEQIHIAVLVEHQSQEDDIMLFRLLEYSACFWLQHRTTYQEQARLHQAHPLSGSCRYPMLFNVVVYTGSRPWQGPLDIHSLLDVPPALPLDSLERSLVPQLKMILVPIRELPATQVADLDHLLRWAFALQRGVSASELQHILAELTGLLAHPSLRAACQAFELFAANLLLARHQGVPSVSTEELAMFMRQAQENNMSIVEYVKER